MLFKAKLLKLKEIAHIGCQVTSLVAIPGAVRGFIADNRGAGAVDMAMFVIVLLVTIMIGGLIFTQVGALITTQVAATNNTQAIAGLAQVTSSGWSAFTLLAIAAFVGAAVVILGMLLGIGGRGGTDGGEL